MATAIVCLPSRSKTIINEIKHALNDGRVRLFNDVDDGLEFLWNDGKDVGLFVLDLDEDHIDEIWNCAKNWPALHFIAMYSEDVGLPLTLDNISVFSPPNEIQEAIREISQLYHHNALKSRMSSFLRSK